MVHENHTPDPELEIKLLDNSKFNVKNVTKEEIEGVPGAFLLRNALSSEECHEIVDQVFSTTSDLEGSTPVLWRSWAENPDEEYKKLGARVIRRSEAYAEALFQRVKSHLPAIVETKNSKEKITWELSGLSEKIRFIKYDAGQSFPPHTDGPYVKTDTKSSHFTVLFYLDKSGGMFSVNSDFRGGELYFLKKNGDALAKIFKVSPEPGLVVIFPHKTLHEGNSLKSGHKYLIRSDAMYDIIKREPLTNTNSPALNEVAHDAPVEQDQH